MTVGLPPRDEWPFTQFEPVLDSRPYSQHVKAKSFSHCYACDGARAHKWSGDALACHTCGYAR